MFLIKQHISIIKKQQKQEYLKINYYLPKNKEIKYEIIATDVNLKNNEQQSNIVFAKA